MKQKWRVVLQLAICIVSFSMPAMADSNNIDAWRGEVVSTRLLAENNALAAYKQAQQLQLNIPRGATPVDWAQALNLLSRIEAYLALTDVSMIHAQQAFDLAKKNADRVGQAEADLILAMNFINKGKLDDQATVVSHSVTMLEGVNRSDLLSEAKVQLSMLYRRMGKVDDSADMSMHTLELAKHSGDPVALTYAYWGIASSFGFNERPAEAHYYFTLMREQAISAHTRRLEAIADAGLGHTAFLFGNLAEGERLMREALNIDREIGMPFAVSFDLLGLAENLKKQGRTAAALKALNEAVKIYKQYPNKIGLWLTLSARSTYVAQLGDAAAKADAELAYSISREVGFHSYISESAQRLAAFYAKGGEYRRAYALTDESIKMLSSVAPQKDGARVLELAQRFEAENKQRQVDNLMHINHEQADKLRQQYWVFAITGIILAILGITLTFLLRLKSAYRRLQQEKDKKQAILAAIPDFLCEVGLDGRYYDVHFMRSDFLGMPAEALLGKTVSDVMPEEAAKIFLSALREAFEAGLSVGSQISLPQPQGRHWFELSISHKPAVSAEEPRFIVISRDISERKRLEEAVRERDRHFSNLVESWPDNIGRFDLNARMLYINPKLELEIGRASSDVIGWRMDEIFPQNQMISSFQKVLEQVIASGQFAEFEMTREPVVGERRMFYDLIRIAPELGEFGKVIGAIAIGRNIAHIKRMETMLRQSESEFRTLAENSPEIIVRYDLSCRRLYINPAYEKITGLTKLNVLNKAPVDAWSAHTCSKEYTAWLNGVINTGAPDHILLEFLQLDGELMSHDMHAVAEYDEHGKVSAVLAIGHNITYLKTTKRKLEKSQSLLRQMAARNETVREDERRELAREIHDELGQYLMALHMNVTAVGLTFGETNPALQEETSQLITLVESTIQVVRNVVDSLRPKVLDIGIIPALEWLVDAYQKRTAIPCQLHILDKTICLDDNRATAVFRVVQESLTNIGRHAKASKVEIFLEYTENQYELQVRDNGIGFDPSLHKDRSFGLIGMQERALMLGGNIEILSAPGCGTVIKVSIPVNYGME